MKKTLMLQGTGSDVGKSILTAALGRLLQRQGRQVAPFKPQNMALNSYVTPDGGEIGRAQAVQALACGIKASVHMNPVLLKPNSDTGAQVIVQGRAIGNMEAVGFHDYKDIAMAAVLDSYGQLQAQYQTILVEGAGSPAEVNLRQRDIANMGFAEAVDCDVILVADIDKGGVFAQIVGTLELLSESERKRIKGFIINKFRGDVALLQPGLEWLEAKTGKPVLGVIPYLHNLYLDAEDAIDDAQDLDRAKLKVIVPVLPRISNHNDFDPLRHHPEIDLQFVPLQQPPPAADLIILPGSKNVRADLEALRRHGWPDMLARHCRYGGQLLGICGGYQMLGQSIADPLGLEGEPGSSPGLGLLPIETTLAANKQLCNIQGRFVFGGARVSGYEIHAGVSNRLADCDAPFTLEDGRPEGAISADGQVLGTYLHGLFDNGEMQQALLHWCGIVSDRRDDYETLRQAQLDRLADTLEAGLDMARLEQILQAGEQHG